MKKLIKILKKGIALILVIILSFNSFSAVVGDNDGSAFITKAEFDSLKSTFQAQIDQYNTSIDSKIDGAIAGYLAGIRLSKSEVLESLIDGKYKNLEMIGNDSALGWKRIDSKVTFTGVCYASFWRQDQTSSTGWSTMSREGLVRTVWTRKNTPTKKEVYSMTSVDNDSKIYNPQKDKRYVDGKHKLICWTNNAISRYYTSNWSNPVIAYGHNKYGVQITKEPFAAARAAAWQEGLSFGQYVDNATFQYKQPNKNRTSEIYSYKLATADDEDPTIISTQPLSVARIDNWSNPTGWNSNYFMGMSGTEDENTYAVVNELKYEVDANALTLLGCVGTFNDHILQFYDADASNLYINCARMNGSINKSDMKYDVKGEMWLYQHQLPWRSSQNTNNILRQDATNSYSMKDIVPTTIRTYTPSSTTSGDWPNMLPYDIIITSLAFKKSINKSKIAYYNKDILSKKASDKLTNYLDNYSWAYGFPLWEVDKNGTLSFKPQFSNDTTTYLVWCLRGPSSSSEPYTSAPTNYYHKADNCKLTQRTSGYGQGAFECKSGDNIIIKDIEKNDVIYLYFTTTDGKAGPILKNNMTAIFESEN